MLALNFIMAYLAIWLMKMVGRILLAILAIINATAVYFITTYSVMIDATTIENVFNTRYSEASGFFSWGLWLFIAGCGVLPALCFQHDEQAEEIKLPDGKIGDKEKAVVVLVIGESARKANFQLYGYKRETNPLLSKQDSLRVYEATSCATYTTAGSKAILEPQNSDDLYELLPNYAFRTGVDVAWRTSNWGEPPIHIDEYLIDTELAEQYPDVDKRYDGILFAGLRERIEASKRDKVLIILHTSTSHGPKYADKYPQEFEVYKPVVKSVEEGEKNIGLLVNAYDNTIRYTDFLLDSLINTLRSMTDWRSAMIFISDHGESLGENGLFMHGLPMKLAPKVQYEIPFLVWTSDGFRRYKSAKKLPAVLEQHYIFHSVLNLLSIESPAYNSDYDIFSRWTN